MPAHARCVMRLLAGQANGASRGGAHAWPLSPAACVGIGRKHGHMGHVTVLVQRVPPYMPRFAVSATNWRVAVGGAEASSHWCTKWPSQRPRQSQRALGPARRQVRWSGRRRQWQPSLPACRKEPRQQLPAGTSYLLLTGSPCGSLLSVERKDGPAESAAAGT